MKIDKQKRVVLVLMAAALLLPAPLAGCQGNPVALETDRVPAAGLGFYQMVAPAAAQIPADHLEDETLIGLVADHLFPNGCTAFDWVTGLGLMVDKRDAITDAGGRTLYRCYDFPTAAILKANLALIFSERLLENSVYPACFEGDNPVFIEQEGTLYGFLSGADISTEPFFESARRITKADASFDLELPMLLPDDTVAEYFILRVVLQNGNWVLDSFPYFA